MTSKLTKERVVALIAEHSYDSALVDALEHLLAAMDSEPVAYIFKHPAGRLFWSLTDESNKGHDDVMPVYAAPQSPGSEPATVPGKWIPVSERMPENDGAYLCWDNRYVTTYAFIFGAWQANQFIAKNITHWMPLPAGPQEVR